MSDESKKVDVSEVTAVCWRLRRRSEIRRSIPDRKSVKEGRPDRIADLLDEAEDLIQRCWRDLNQAHSLIEDQRRENEKLKTVLTLSSLL